MAAPGGRLQIKVQDWPKLDQELWELAMAPGDILSSAGNASKWRAQTRITVSKGYGGWLQWLTSEGLLDPSQPPLARAKPESIAAFVEHIRLRGNSSTTVWNNVNSLCCALKAMYPNTNLDSLWAIERRLHWEKVPKRRKADQVVPVVELYRLGVRLMDDAACGVEISPLLTARLYRDGLIIALLAARPIRLHNLHSIRIGKNLVIINGIYHLLFSADEMKTHRALEFALPSELSIRMAEYLAVHRPILVQQKLLSHMGAHCAAGDALWVSPFGTALTRTTIYTTIVDVTRKHLGYPINPHLFRHCAATSVGLEDPDNVHIIMSILGHSSPLSGERYYNHAQAIHAVEAHQRGILSVRKEFTKRITAAQLVNSRRRKVQWASQ